MNSPFPIIVVWAFLAAVLVAYVAYRFITDRRSDSKTHSLYPFASNPSDGVFPKGGYLGRAAYLIILFGLLGFVGIIYVEVTNQAAPSYLVNFVGISIVVGIGMLGLSKFLSKDGK